MDAIRDARESQRRSREEPRGGGGPTYEVPAPHLLKQGQLQLAGASFRDYFNPCLRDSVHLLGDYGITIKSCQD